MNVLVASVQHTGTVFTLETLKRIFRLYFKRIKIRAKSPELDKIKRGFRGSGIIQAHFGYNTREEIKILAKACPTIIPFRDPLASIISLRNRHNKKKDPLKGHNLIKGWVEFSGLLDEIPNPFYFPVDLLTEPKFRYRKMLDLEDFTKWTLDKEEAKLWSEEWPSDGYNSKGNYELKQQYLQGTLDYSRWIEVKMFRDLTNLHPLLKNIGYDLNWLDR